MKENVAASKQCAVAEDRGGRCLAEEYVTGRQHMRWHAGQSVIKDAFLASHGGAKLRLRHL